MEMYENLRESIDKQVDMGMSLTKMTINDVRVAMARIDAQEDGEDPYEDFGVVAALKTHQDAITNNVVYSILALPRRKIGDRLEFALREYLSDCEQCGCEPWGQALAVPYAYTIYKPALAYVRERKKEEQD